MDSKISTGLLAILLFCGGSLGQGSSLTFSSLPSQQGWIYEDGFGSTYESQIFSVTGNSLVLNSINKGYSGFAYSTGLTASSGNKFVMTAILKITNYQIQSFGNPYGFEMAFQIGQEWYEMAISPLGIYAAEGSAHTHNWISTSVDVTQLHEYRLEAQGNGISKIFVDNILLGTALPWPISGNPKNAAYFGDATAGANSRVEIYSLKIEGGNSLPLANAGENVTIASTSINSTTLLGAATDSDAGGILQYRWLNGTNILLDWTAVNLDGSCPLNLSGNFFGLGQSNLVMEVNDGTATTSDEMILTIENSAPTVALSGNGLYEIGSNIVLGGTVSDFDGDLLHYSWTIAGNTQCEGNIQTTLGGSPVTLDDCDADGLDLGSHEATLQVSDEINTPILGVVQIQITDNTNPTLSPVASQGILWPPNHQMVSIIIATNAADNSGNVALSASVSSNEIQDGLGDGDEPQDWTQPVIDPTSGNISLTLRSERSGKGIGRIYSISVSATDSSGNESITTVEVKVPHSQSKK